MNLLKVFGFTVVLLPLALLAVRGAVRSAAAKGAIIDY